MNQKQYTTEKQKYVHLNLCERKEIEKCLRTGYSIGAIARALGRSKSTVSREIRRGSVTQRKLKQSKPIKKEHLENWLPYKEFTAYFADTGNEVARNNKSRSGGKYKLFKDEELVKYIENKILVDKYSPDAIIGGLPYAGQNFKIRVCTKTVYNYIDKGLLKVKNIDLLMKVRLNPKKRLIRAQKRQLGKSIELRPPEIETRQDFGHWEGDTIIGKNHKGAILTLVERKTDKGFMIKLSDKSAPSVIEAFKQLKDKMHLFKTITFDNGSEFSDCTDLENGNLQIYYAHPYSAFERGTNENYNRIIRRFIPKGKSFDNIGQETLNRINNWIDTYPRKRHGYKSADEMFARELENFSLYPAG
jgi:IS30 family transposase